VTNTTDVSLPTDRDIVVTRAFDAPASLVFDCHTKPELVRRWLVTSGWTMPVCDIDLRVGGKYHYVWRNEADGNQFGFVGEYREISAPNRIVHLERPEGAPEGGDAHCTLALTEKAGRTTLTYTMRFPSREVRDQVLKTGMTDGMTQTYKLLDTLLEELAPSARAVAR
jgi:uncharacterized protein YndB with AHSA1/START domain